MSRIVNKLNVGKYIWGNDCLSWILYNTENLSIKQELMPIGTKEQLHFHEKSCQFFYVLKGEATLYLEDERFLLNSNDGLRVLNNTRHFIANESNEEIEFLVISQPGTNNDRVNL